jgi:hypothetical protein
LEHMNYWQFPDDSWRNWSISADGG